MREPSALTVMAEVPRDEWDALRDYLKDRVNPKSCGASRDLKFERYPNLHFLSFFMPKAMETHSTEENPTGGYLVMEATFDGPEDAFIRDLVDGDLSALMAIFGTCRGFPQMAEENPHLVEIFLTQRTIPSSTFFSGAPGRSVTEIKRDYMLRRKLGDILRAAPAEVLAAEPRRLQDHLRREAMRDEDLRPMAQPARPAASLTDSKKMMGLALSALALLVALIGALVFCVDFVSENWQALATPDLGRAAWILAVAAILLVVLRIAQDSQARAAAKVNPDTWPFVRANLAMGASLIIKIIAAIIAVQAVFLLAACANDWVWPKYSWWMTHAIWSWLLYWPASVVVYIVLLIVFAGIYALAGFFGFTRASAGRLQRTDRTKSDSFGKSIVSGVVFVLFWAVFALSWTPLAMVLIVTFGPSSTAAALCVWSWVVTLGGWFAAGLLVVLVVWVILLIMHDRKQEGENEGLRDPLELYDTPLEDPERWAKEEHGYQRHQNHYISLTNVKDGWVRYGLLIMALTIVNFLARYKDNKGTLGGIPTIFSARWALIDAGKRLLFMTNYSGAWDSYLNEFSELASVFGVNLIWTNTYIAPEDTEAERGVYFPETELFTGRGARKTLPFKAYVRQSQLETLVWYGAYRDLSVINVTENARIREAVFGPTDAAALDLLLKRL